MYWDHNSVTLKVNSLNRSQLYIPYNDTSLALISDEGCRNLIEQLFNTLMEAMSNTDSYKVITLYFLMEDGGVGRINNLHKSIILNKDCTFESYWNSVAHDIMDNLIEMDFEGYITFVYNIDDLNVPENKKLVTTNGIGKLVNEQRNLTPFKKVLTQPKFINKRSFHTSPTLPENKLLDGSELINRFIKIQEIKKLSKSQAELLRALMTKFYKDELEMISKMNPTLNEEELFMLCKHYHDEKDLVDIINSGFDPKLKKYVFEMWLNYPQNNIKYDLWSLFHTLITDSGFESVCENKLVLLQAWLEDGKIYTIHHAVLINKFTTFDNYWNEVMKEAIHWEELYGEDSVRFDYIVIDIDQEMKLNPQLNIIRDIKKATYEHGLIIRRKHPEQSTKPGRKPKRKLIPIKLGLRNISSITPIPNTKFKANFSVMDIETVNINNSQVPVCISFCSEIGSKVITINRILYLEKGIKIATEKMWFDFFDYIMETRMRSHVKTIFTHNLGGFDGYFIYSALLKYFDDSDKYDLIIDDKNKIISIQIKIDQKFTISFKDSFRIFPVSLDKLCKSFGVEGKLMTYNPRFQNIDYIFRLHSTQTLLEFEAYAIQDSRALYNALVIAQKEYFDKYQVDITSIYSTSSLSLKIFRTNFLKNNIAILDSLTDQFVRRGYLGGATDYFKAFARFVYYYDVNSLYPYAMKMILPNKPIQKHNDMSNIKLENFFGFALAEIYCPDSITIPLLPYKDPITNRTIHPKGTWQGVYLSPSLVN